MYTTFILDEVGNRKIIMDWRGSPRFKWNEVKVADLLSQYPNHCAGLTFGYFWTGDDWHPQQNRVVSPKYGCLPSFKGPDLPSPRTPLENTGPHTRKSGDKSAPSYLPVEVEDKASDVIKGRPRIRCAICAWNLGLQGPFERTLPGPEPRPEKPPLPNQFATMIRNLIQEGKVTRRQLGESLIGNHRWRNLDRWMDTDQAGKKKFYAPRPEQCTRLLSVVGVDVGLYLEAIEEDKTNFKRTQQWSGWQEMHSYPEWATVEDKDDEVWYHHHHCGRSTRDLSEVISHRVVSIEIEGRTLAVLLEDWKEGDRSWQSIAVPKGDSVNQTMLEKQFPLATEWQETDCFYFGIIPKTRTDS